MGNLLERKTVKLEFESKYSHIVHFLELEMDNTKKLFDEQKLLFETTNEILVHRNMPNVSGALKWCQELKDRITKPMDNFKKLVDNPIMHSEVMERVEKKYRELLVLLEKFGNSFYEEWCIHVGRLSDNNLEKNLIYRDLKTKSIKTNFDPQVKLFGIF